MTFGHFHPVGSNTPKFGGRAHIGANLLMFVSSLLGSKDMAIAFTLKETAKCYSVNRHAWLTDVLERIADLKITRLDDLMCRYYAQT